MGSKVLDTSALRGRFHHVPDRFWQSVSEPGTGSTAKLDNQLCSTAFVIVNLWEESYLEKEETMLVSGDTNLNKLLGLLDDLKRHSFSPKLVFGGSKT
jgi:hypothetical protein